MTAKRVRQNAKSVGRQKNMIVLPLLLLTVVTLCALFGGGLLGRAGLAGRSWPTEGLDPRAESFFGSPFEKFHEANPPDVLSYRIKEVLRFSDGKAQGAFFLASPIQNGSLMRVELCLDETGEAVFSSGHLSPGQQIKKAALDLPLSAGEYAATAVFYAVDADGGDRGVLRQPVTIIVLS